MMLSDLRVAARMLRRSPAFTAAAVLTLALGVGANTAVFSVLRAVLIEPLPFPDADRLVTIEELNPGWSTTLASSHAFLEFRDRSRSFQQMAAAAWWDANLETGPEPARVTEVNVSPGFFETMGLSPWHGRVFTAEESRRRGGSRAVLSFELWQRLGADPGLVNRSIRVGGVEHTVLGVMPPVAANSPFLGWGDLWTPWHVDEAAARVKPSAWRGFRVVGRLAPGVSIAAADREISDIEQQLARELPAIYSGYTGRVRSLLDYAAGRARPLLLVLSGAVLFVLLVACANVANQLLVRGAAREGELAVRVALGARRTQIARLQLSEALLLSGLGLVTGLGLAAAAIPILRELSMGETARAAGARLDLTTMALGALAAALTAALCALAPLAAFRQVNPADALAAHARGASGSRRHAGFRSAIVASQIALAAVLLAGAGLMLRTTAKLAGVDPGFRAQNVVVADVMLPGIRYQQHAQRIGFFRTFLEHAAAVPGVVAVGANRYFPLRDRQFSNPIFIEGRPVERGREPIVQYAGITSGYFEAMGIPVVAGRDFTAHEMWDQVGAVIINQTLAARIWPAEDPIGRRLKHGADQPWLTVVGVVGDVRQRRIDEPPYPQIYVPYSDYKHTTMSIAVRTAGPPEPVIPALRAVVRSLDPQLPLFNVTTLDRAVAGNVGARQNAGRLLVVFAAVALLMAMIGIYGVTAYSVSQRRRDLAIHLALGATRRDVIRRIMLGGSTALGAGAIVGLLLTALLSRSLSAVLFEVSPLDPLVFAASGATLIAAGLLACYLPARRAAAVNAATALRG
jgi:putative ABC transport system permease protein